MRERCAQRLLVILANVPARGVAGGPGPNPVRLVSGEECRNDGVADSLQGQWCSRLTGGRRTLLRLLTCACGAEEAAPGGGSSAYWYIESIHHSSSYLEKRYISHLRAQPCILRSPFEYQSIQPQGSCTPARALGARRFMLGA